MQPEPRERNYTGFLGDDKNPECLKAMQTLGEKVAAGIQSKEPEKKPALGRTRSPATKNN
jgi:hypothetical protein